MSSSHQSKFPCIIITIIIILLFFSSFSTLLTVNLFVLFWRCFVMLNSYFVCFIIYIFFFNFEIFFVDIIFVPKIGVCFSFYPVSLIFEYEAKPHIRWPHIREYEAGESGANFTSVPWWRHQMETSSALLAICAGNSPVNGEFPSQRPVTRSLDVFFYLRLNKRLSKQSWGWWFETPSRSLWCHFNDYTCRVYIITHMDFRTPLRPYAYKTYSRPTTQEICTPFALLLRSLP